MSINYASVFLMGVILGQWLAIWAITKAIATIIHSSDEQEAK